MCAYALLAGLLTLACAKAPAPEIMEADGYRFVPLTAERLPDMNEARQNHVMVCLNGEFTAIGGHTTGFVTSQSAEYFKNGKWQLVPSLYVHDDPVYAQLPDGRVLVAGGYEKDFGIGQTWGAEIYDPATHQFSYQPILDQKRAHSNGLALEDGRVVISGNWYAKDWTEVFDGQSFVKLTDGSEERTYPYILATAPDSAIIFGIRDPHDYLLERKVDRLDGSSFEVSLLRDWEPYRYPAGDLCRYRTGNYSWLLPVADTAGTRAFLQVQKERFTLLEWPRQLPAQGPWGPISWQPELQVEPESHTAWIWSFDKEHTGRLYFACLDYEALLKGENTDWTIYYTDCNEQYPYNVRILALPDGDILLAGGDKGSNYEPVSTVWLLHTQPGKRSSDGWIWILSALLALLLCLGLFRPGRKCREKKASQPASQIAPDLLTRITSLMEEEQLFRQKDLRMGDLASRLGTNSTYVSACLNNQLGVSFPSFVAKYRVEYAQRLMRDNPEKTLSLIAEESGFATEANFFRTFKQLTGVTPKEWRGKLL